MVFQLEVVSLLKTLYILKEILKELNKNLNWLIIILLAPLKGKRKRRNIKNQEILVIWNKEPVVNNPNDVSISDAETESGNEHEDDNNKQEETAPPVAKKHGREREPWVQKPMPFPSKSHKTKEEH